MIPRIPPLHVGETVAEVTVLDGRAVAIAMALLAVAVVVIWRPVRVHLVGLRRVRGLRSAGQAGVLALALVAVLPAAVPYDHLLLDVGSDEQAAHSQHCHGAGDECSGSSAQATTTPFLDTQVLLIAPALLSVALFVLIIPLRGLTRRPDLRPPLAATA